APRAPLEPGVGASIAAAPPAFEKTFGADAFTCELSLEAKGGLDFELNAREHGEDPSKVLLDLAFAGHAELNAKVVGRIEFDIKKVVPVTLMAALEGGAKLNGEVACTGAVDRAAWNETMAALRGLPALIRSFGGSLERAWQRAEAATGAVEQLVGA